MCDFGAAIRLVFAIEGLLIAELAKSSERKSCSAPGGLPVNAEPA
jgi:hypothetical protein